jgi:hypothetical protein
MSHTRDDVEMGQRGAGASFLLKAMEALGVGREC